MSQSTHLAEFHHKIEQTETHLLIRGNCTQHLLIILAIVNQRLLEQIQN